MDYNDTPCYGYGHRRRPLGTPRDFVAELIRRTLRRGWHREHTDDVVKGGFAVEGGHDIEHGGPGEFFVACTDFRRENGAPRYRDTLVKAGWTVRTDADGHLAVDATKPLRNPPRWLAKQFARQPEYGIGQINA